jgi:transcriptional regulator with XRE-family HTH domain
MTNLGPLLDRIGLKQKDLASELGVTEEQVSRWVNGHHVPGGENLACLLHALQKRDPEIKLTDLFGKAA